MRMLVCGGRHFDNASWLRVTLDEMHKNEPVSCLIEGGALGADRLAREWAIRAGAEVMTFDADWMAHGKKAGPMRNRRMLQEGMPDLVVAFPGGAGTANLLNQARWRGIQTAIFTESVYSKALSSWVVQ